jgi:valine dehydrogenase (NAD+)
LTAFGVYQGMRAAAQYRWGSDSLEGRTIGIAGAGKVGRHLTGHLARAGAKIVIADPNEAALGVVLAEYPLVSVVAPEQLTSAAIDLYSPCALGHALDVAAVAALRAEIVCGAANNQLASPEIGLALAQRDILYAPDYVVNAGGVIQVADEIAGFEFARARERAAGIYDTTLRILTEAGASGVTPAAAADRLAEERMAYGTV